LKKDRELERSTRRNIVAKYEKITIVKWIIGYNRNCNSIIFLLKCHQGQLAYSTKQHTSHYGISLQNEENQNDSKKEKSKGRYYIGGY
jgi:hypothetical protein